MGNSGSFESNLQSKTSNINTQHSDIDQTILRINAEANRLIELILQRKYNDREGICKRIGYQKVDELSGLFKIQTLNGIRYRLGIIPENTPELEANKQKVCLDIVNFYVKKINLITNIQKELPNCREMERNIYDNLAAKLNSRQLNNEQWLNVYNKLEKFNEEISSRYSLFERELERVRKATTMNELNAIAVTTHSILTKTNNICKNYEHDLIEFSNKSMEENQMYSPTYPRSPRVQRVQTAKIELGLEKDIEERKREIAERKAEEQRLEEELRLFSEPSPQIPLSPQVVVSPKVVSPQVPLYSEPRVVKTRIVAKKPEISPVRERTTVYPPASYPASPKLVHETTISPRGEVVHNTVISPFELQEKEDELPYVPVERFPEMRPSGVQTTVKADRIIRGPSGTIIQNPRAVKRTEIIPRENIGDLHRTLAPGNKTIAIQPIHTGRTRGIPVRAVENYAPRSRTELELRKGQATLFLDKSTGGWAKVQHADGRTGFVPHKFLSKN